MYETRAVFMLNCAIFMPDQLYGISDLIKNDFILDIVFDLFLGCYLSYLVQFSSVQFIYFTYS